MKHPLPAMERLQTFAALLAQWNTRINLIAPMDLPHVWERHILDSMQLAALLPQSWEDLVDLGSGAGFPGIVLAIVTGRRVHLVEPDHRKGAFLREVARATGVAATIHPHRAEQLRLPPASVVTARALAPLQRLLALAAPILAPDGVCLFPKGRTVEAELTAASREWHMQIERFPSRTSQAATILRIRKIARVPPTR